MDTSSPISRLAAVAFVALSALGTSACEFSTAGATGNPVGVGNLRARSTGTAYTTSPVIAFYRVTAASFITTAAVRDTCFTAAYAESSTNAPSNAPPLSAGTTITVAIGSRVDTLARPSSATDETYRTKLAAGIPYTPGDSMIFTISGDPNGFPASSFRGKTAEAFTLAPLVITPAGDPINVSWSPAGGSNSAMLLTMRYAAGTSTTFNRQVACTFVDDGSGVVPGFLADVWRAASTRDHIAQRMRTIFSQVEVPRSFFNMVSTFDWPTPTTY